MKRYRPIWLFVVTNSLVWAALTGCAPDTSAPELDADAREVRIAAENSALTATAPASVPAETAVTTEPFIDTACLECHMDQEQLKELAVEEEVTESLSEGPG